MKKTTKTARVSLEFQKENAPELCTFADGTITGLTGNAFITLVPVPVGTVASQAASVRADLQKIASGNTSKTLTALLATDANVLMISLTSNGHSVQDQANTLAAGNLTKAKQIISSTGYKLAKDTTHKTRDFEVLKSDPNTVHVHVKKAKKGTESHLWRYGLTPAKNIPPTILKMRVTVESDLIISDLPSASIVGIQHASVVGVSHTKKTGTTETSTSKVASSISLSKSKHPVISHLTDDPYQWSDFIYAVIL